MILANINDVNEFLIPFGLKTERFVVTNELPSGGDQSRRASYILSGIEALNTESLIVRIRLGLTLTSNMLGACDLIDRKFGVYNSRMDLITSGPSIKSVEAEAKLLELPIKVVELSRFRDLYLLVYCNQYAQESCAIKLSQGSDPEIVNLISTKAENLSEEPLNFVADDYSTWLPFMNYIGFPEVQPRRLMLYTEAGYLTHIMHVVKIDTSNKIIKYRSKFGIVRDEHYTALYIKAWKFRHKAPFEYCGTACL
jgi:hypothetical protein